MKLLSILPVLAGLLLSHESHAQSHSMMASVVPKAATAEGLGRWTAGSFSLSSLSRPDGGACKAVGVWFDMAPRHVMNYRVCGKQVTELGVIGRPTRTGSAAAGVRRVQTVALQQGAAQGLLEDFLVVASSLASRGGSACQIETSMTSGSLLAYFHVEDICR